MPAGFGSTAKWYEIPYSNNFLTVFGLGTR